MKKFTRSALAVLLATLMTVTCFASLLGAQSGTGESAGAQVLQGEELQTWLAENGGEAEAAAAASAEPTVGAVSSEPQKSGLSEGGLPTR